MAGQSVQTVTVDRISNSGNAIAEQTRDGKTIHVRASQKIGDTLEVALTDKGGYYEARLVDRTKETTPREPGIGSKSVNVGVDHLRSKTEQSHSFGVRSSVNGETVSEELSSWVNRRKM